MSDRSEQEQLLHDVLAESAAPDFREALLAKMLRQARHRRRWRQARPVAGLLTILFALGWLGWHNRAEKPLASVQPKPVPVQNSYRFVTTQPLPATAFVGTEVFATAKTISSETTVAEIATHSDGFRYLNDAELLAKLGPGTAVLVRTGPHTEELVFSESTDVSAPRPEN
jgi:hypothetical protein